MADSDSKGIWKVGGIAAVVVIVLWVLTWALLVQFGPDGWDKRGQFGDMFGSVNALFSGLAFSGLIVAILLQGQELKAQREELKHTREEVRGQKEQLALQAETMAVQQFEATFFQMIRLHHDLVSGFESEGIRGRSAIRRVFDRRGEKDYGDVARRLPVEQYFRNYRETVKYVVNDDRLRYMEILRAQMSNDEQTLLFLYCLDRQITNPSDELFGFVGKYRLLAHWEAPQHLREVMDMLPEGSYGIKLKSSI